LKTTFHKNLKAFTLCAGFFSLVACKEKSTIKTDTIPDVDNINTFEVNDLSVSVRNTYFDSLQTNLPSYPVVGIGGISDDPFFGKTNAGAYMQFSTPSDNFTFPTGAIFDSAVISLPYLNFVYADTTRSNTNIKFKLKAYEITGAFNINGDTSKFFTSTKLNYNTTALAEGEIPLKSLFDTTVLSNGDTITGLLRFRADGLINRFANISAASFATDAAFFQEFKGLYIAPDTTKTQNVLGYFGMFNGNSTLLYNNAQLEFYLHTATDATPQRFFFRFFNGTTMFFNGIYRNYNGLPALSHFNSQTTDHDSLIVQGYPGFRADLTVKIDNKIPPSIINKATITLTALKVGDDARFNPPALLNVTAIDDDGTERVVADMVNNDGTANSSAQLFVGGSATKVSINGTDFVQYQLNIPREFQKAISEGKTQLKLRISSSTTYAGSFRMVADGPNSSNANTRMKLNIIYTKLK
jgi:hypothetical protein